jgi:hypothetical protein
MIVECFVLALAVQALMLAATPIEMAARSPERKA